MISPEVGALFVPLRAFLLAYVVPAGTEVVQGLDNGVPMPLDPFVLMTPILQRRLSTNRHEYTDLFPDDGAQDIATPLQIDVQLDFYGPLAASWAAAAVQLLRDPLACDELGPSVQPLYCDDAGQAALVTAERRYEGRWLCTASFAYTPVTTIPQQFADQASVELVEVDTRYPPT